MTATPRVQLQILADSYAAHARAGRHAEARAALGLIMAECAALGSRHQPRIDANAIADRVCAAIESCRAQEDVLALARAADVHRGWSWVSVRSIHGRNTSRSRAQDDVDRERADVLALARAAEPHAKPRRK